MVGRADEPGMSGAFSQQHVTTRGGLDSPIARRYDNSWPSSYDRGVSFIKKENTVHNVAIRRGGKIWGAIILNEILTNGVVRSPVL